MRSIWQVAYFRTFGRWRSYLNLCKILLSFIRIQYQHVLNSHNLFDLYDCLLGDTKHHLVPMNFFLDVFYRLQTITNRSTKVIPALVDGSDLVLQQRQIICDLFVTTGVRVMRGRFYECLVVWFVKEDFVLQRLLRTITHAELNRVYNLTGFSYNKGQSYS